MHLIRLSFGRALRLMRASCLRLQLLNYGLSEPKRQRDWWERPRVNKRNWLKKWRCGLAAGIKKIYDPDTLVTLNGCWPRSFSPRFGLVAIQSLLTRRHWLVRRQKTAEDRRSTASPNVIIQNVARTHTATHGRPACQPPPHAHATRAVSIFMT